MPLRRESLPWSGKGTKIGRLAFAVNHGKMGGPQMNGLSNRIEPDAFMNKSDAQIARKSILLAKVPEDLFTEILSRSPVRSFKRGATIFLQGDRAKSVFLVLEGWVKLFRIAHNGAEAVVGVFTRGSTFAEGAAFQGERFPVTAEAVSDCRLIQIDAALLLSMMASRPELCSAIIASTFKHLHDLVQNVEQLMAQTGAQRLARFLVDLSPMAQGACTVTLPYDKVLIAGRLGMKPESLSRAFARLREVGVSVRQNHAAIADVEQLANFVEEDRASAWAGQRDDNDPRSDKLP